MIYVILGMHKSGTTLVSQILHHSGINMGGNIDTHIQYDEGNQYERLSTQALNQEILGSYHMRSIDIRAPGKLNITEEQRCWLQAIIRDSNGHGRDWGFKDPRTTLTYPLWKQDLPEHKLICIYRSLDELWLRYQQLGILSRYHNLSRAYKLVLRWSEHNGRIIEYLGDASKDGLLLEYSRMMSDDVEYNRLQDFVGIPLVDKRKPGLYRNKTLKRPFVLRLGVWWAQKINQVYPDKIASELEHLREQN